MLQCLQGLDCHSSHIAYRNLASFSQESSGRRPGAGLRWFSPWLLHAFIFCLVSAELDGSQQTDPRRTGDPDETAVPGAAEPSPATDAGVAGFPKLIARDFKNVFTRKENAVTIGIGLAAAGGASYFDDRIASSGLNSELHPGTNLDHFFEPGEVLGGGLLQVGGALATYGAGKLWSKPGIEDLGRDLVRAQIVTQSFTFAIKRAVGRERPDGSSHRSFPSGHASTSFATATVFQRHYGWKAGIPAYAVAGFIATSRLNESRHYLSDVVFGAALGIMVGRTVTVDIAEKRFVVTPIAKPGEVGIQITLLP